MSEIKFPITIKNIKFDDSFPLMDKAIASRIKRGDFVAVRPCDEKYENKTFLGIFLGELAMLQSCKFNEKEGELEISRCMYNPMMYVPDIKQVVFGCESWWSRIKSEEDLKQITDKDIDNVWYVRALKGLDAVADLDIEDE